MTNTTLSSGSASGGVLSAGDTLTVSSGAVASQTVLTGGSATILGTVSTTTVDQTGLLVVSGGTAVNTTVSGGGQFIIVSSSSVSSGGVPRTVRSGLAISTTVESGGLYVVNHGAAGSDTSLVGGKETVYGVADATTVGSGGFLAVSSGTAVNTIVTGGNSEFLLVSGGSASQIAVGSGGLLVVEESTASGLTVTSGGLVVLDYASISSAGGFAYVSSAIVESGGVIIASSGTSATNVTLSSGGHLVEIPGAQVTDVTSSGGTLVSTGIAVIGPGNDITIYSGANDIQVSSGAEEIVLSGGVASGGSVAALASQQIFSGGAASGAVLASGGYQTVNIGALASFTTVGAGAAEYVFSGGAVSGTILDSGFLLVNAGGSATASAVSSGGIEAVDGAVLSTVLSIGGEEDVVLSGTATSTRIESGGQAYIHGNAIGTVIENGGYEVVDSSGALARAVVSKGGVLVGDSATTTVSSTFAGAVIADTTIHAGGTELVLSGATDIGVTVESGGTYIALPGASTILPTFESGANVVTTGIVLVSGPATVSTYSSAMNGLQITSGMLDYLLASGTESGTVIGNHGYVEVDSGGLIQDTMIQGGGTLAILSGGIASGSIDFVTAGGTLALDGSLSSNTLVNGFVDGDTIDFNGFGGGSTVSLQAGNTLVMTSGALSASVDLGSGTDYSSSTFSATQTATGQVVTITGASTSAAIPPATGSTETVQPIDLPLYVLPYDNGYKIGIEASLDGGSTYRMYEFDTGGTGFYAAYSPGAWSSYTSVSPTPIVMDYVSGNSYVAQVVSTNVTFQTTDGTPFAANNVDVGLITTARDPGNSGFTAQGWNTTLTSTPTSPPLQGNFYGDFGMSLGTGNGLSAILEQLGGGLANGFIITVGSYPGGTNGVIGNVQVGLTPTDIASFTTTTAMQGQNTLDPYPVSGEPTYTEALAKGTLTLSNATDGSTLPLDTGFIFDTGTPTLKIYEGTTITPSDLSAYLSGGHSDGNGVTQVPDTTTVTNTAPAASSQDSGWTLSFKADDESGLNQADADGNDAANRAGSVNTGLNAFFGYRIMFDVADGILGIQGIACFVAGTRIMTPKGERAVETLRTGDAVVTIKGDARSITWTGHRALDCHRHPWPSAVLPVCVQAHALGPGLPRRDIYLSPDHALYLEDVLIPVKYLINGDTVWQTDRDRVTYYHLELESHDVILAEGLAAETYLETGHRSAFINGGGVIAAHPVFVPEPGEAPLYWEVAGYAPLAVTGPAVERARARLARSATGFDRRTGLSVRR